MNLLWLLLGPGNLRQGRWALMLLGGLLVLLGLMFFLDSLGMEHHTVSRLDECEFIVDRTLRQAIMTQAPAALILSPLLTGGKSLKGTGAAA